jgi:[protein-PII] uridylyltransferase
LYKSTRDIFITNTKEQDLSTLEISRKEKLVQTLSNAFDPKFVREHLNNLPASYAMNNSSDEIRKHLAAVKSYNRDKPVTRFYPHLDSKSREMVIVFHDRVGLFHQICTAVNWENFSIQEARLNTRNDGVVVNTIVIHDMVGDHVVSEQRQRLLQERIERTLIASDEIKIGDQPKRLRKVHHRNRKNRVSFINDSSTKFTILEVRTVNRNGLLKDLTGLAAAKGLNLHFARIITEGEQVTDVFYLAGEDGEKIYNQVILNELETDIKNYLETV